MLNLAAVETGWLSSYTGERTNMLEKAGNMESLRKQSLEEAILQHLQITKIEDRPDGTLDMEGVAVDPGNGEEIRVRVHAAENGEPLECSYFAEDDSGQEVMVAYENIEALKRMGMQTQNEQLEDYYVARMQERLKAGEKPN